MGARLALAGLLIGLAGCGAGSPSEAPPSPSVQESSSVATVAEFEPATLGWWRLFGDLQVDLQVGLLDGSVTARIPAAGLWRNALTNLEVVRGPVAHLVLYGRPMAGQGIELHLVSAVTGEDRAVGVVPATVNDVEIGQSGDALFWTDIGQQAGVWRLDLGSGARTRILAPVDVTAAEASGIRLAAAARPRAQLSLSQDGGRLAALWCAPDACHLQVLDLDTGASGAIARLPNWVDLLGFAADGVWATAHCVEHPLGRVRPGDCAAPDPRAIASDLARSFMFGAELPAGWWLEMRPEPDPPPPPMSFELDVVAVPADGRAPIILEVLGRFGGQG